MDPQRGQTNQLAAASARYTSLLLQRRHRDALDIVHQLLDAGTDVRDVYLEVLEPAQRRIGDLWQRGEVSVAQEHLTTAVTQQAVAAMYPRVFASQPDGRRAVVACVSEELHELGARMVADFLQMAGWDTSYLSANVPIEDIAAEVVAVDAHLLCCSIALPDKVPLVEQTIRSVREVRPDLRILVGGRPFNLAPDLWRTIGADGSAPDARAAVLLADQIVPPKQEVM